MSQFKFFMKPDNFFKNIINLSYKYDFKIIFKRFQSKKHEAGFLNVNLSDDMHQNYLDGDYSQVFISIGAIPKESQDWDF